jgi:hypothetical protein
MVNRFHERVDAGLWRLRATQGTGGLPPAPASSLKVSAGPGAVTIASGENPAALVEEARRSADQAEAQFQADLTAPN